MLHFLVNISRILAGQISILPTDRLAANGKMMMGGEVVDGLTSFTRGGGGGCSSSLNVPGKYGYYKVQGVSQILCVFLKIL